MAGSVYGLRLEGDAPVTDVRDADAGRPVDVSVVAAIDWPAAGGTRLAATADDAGAPFMTVDRHPELGYRITAPGHGAQLVRADGRRVEVMTAGADWQRLLFAQTLPTVAALRGLEPLHAGAVVLAGMAVAVCAPSGTGKSSTVAQLVAAGADFLTDDVLVVEPGPDGVLAHPGPCLASPPAGDPGPKPHVRIAAAAAAPLARVVFLERGGPGTAAGIELVHGDDPRRLLTATFVPHLGHERRLVAQLEACARIAQTATCAILRVPAGVSARDAAATLAEWVTGSV